MSEIDITILSVVSCWININVDILMPFSIFYKPISDPFYTQLESKSFLNKSPELSNDHHDSYICLRVIFFMRQFLQQA